MSSITGIFGIGGVHKAPNYGTSGKNSCPGHANGWGKHETNAEVPFIAWMGPDGKWYEQVPCFHCSSIYIRLKP